MTRDLSKLAAARAEIARFLATHPNHELADSLGVMLRATAPITLDEALSVMVRHANNLSEWPFRSSDLGVAKAAIINQFKDAWSVNIRAQWATIQHFFGRAE